MNNNHYVSLRTIEGVEMPDEKIIVRARANTVKTEKAENDESKSSEIIELVDFKNDIKKKELKRNHTRIHYLQCWKV